MLTRLLLTLWVALLIAVPVMAQPVTSAASPDGRITVSVARDADGRISYAIARDGQPLIAPSRLGFLFTDAPAFDRGLIIADAAISDADTTWEQPWGEQRLIRDRHREFAVTLREERADGRSFVVRFRLFNDGVGFRYEFPLNPGQSVVNIAEELTEFTVARPGTAWWIIGGDWNRYEQLYQRTAIDAVSTAHTPITMRLEDGTHLAFHEAALVDFAGMWFRRTEGQRFRATLAPSGGPARVTRAAPFPTPWRTIRIADNAAGLIDNYLELNLNEPNRLGDVSWVQPHRYVGIWWGMHLGEWSWASGDRHGATTANALRHIDFAAAHGFRGVLIEGWNRGWDGTWFGDGRDFDFTHAYPDFDLERVAAYASERGVRLIGHHETGGNIAVYEAQLDDAMALYQRLGIDSVKTGYVADAGGIRSLAPDGSLRMEWHDGQRMVQHHLRVVEAAARHRIAVNPHEPVKDTGLRRTWPNWVAREGARGMEYNAWTGSQNPVTHEPTLVFTRMLAGPMDFTPGVLSLEGQHGQPLNSTLARQLALYVVLYSPIQMAADLIENLERFPRELAFISHVPTDWAESRLLAGAVGEFAVFARQDRRSDDWFIGGITDETARSIAAPLDFLPAGRRYVATIYRDGPDADYRRDTRHRILIEEHMVTRGDSIDLAMAPGGGIAIRLAPVAATTP